MIPCLIPCLSCRSQGCCVTLCLQLYRNEHESVSRSLQVSSPLNFAYGYGPAHVRPKAPRDCFFQGQQAAAWFSPHYAGPQLQQRLWPHLKVQNPMFQDNARFSEFVSHHTRMSSIIYRLAIRLPLLFKIGILQGLRPHTAVTALHSSTTHH